MSNESPAKKLTKSIFDGAEVTDSLGRKLKLRTPDIIDKMKIREATQFEDSYNRGIAELTLHFSMIIEDGKEFLCQQPPNSKQEFYGLAKRIGEEGYNALYEFTVKHSENKTLKEELADVKK